ncbi:MAG TPA: site-specific DNA-methyltransferase [Gemmatales bacterium]|nr:site-specific DNA-methyltransferase [Gemmatales bacterium]
MQWFYETAVFLHELLAETGSVMVHIGPQVADYVRVILDEVFGPDNFRNSIILPGRAVKNLQQQFCSIQRLQIRHDVLLWYSKSRETRFRPYWVQKHDTGNPEGHWHHFWSTADRPTMRYELFGITPPSGQWVWKRERALVAGENYKRFLRERSGRSLAEYWRDTGGCLEFIRPSPDDGKPQYWREPAERRMADTVWSGTPIYSAAYKYPTEKNETFLSEVLNLACNEGDLVLDCFCGSGTTVAVAEKLGRRWLACDLGRFAIHTTRKRLLGIPDVKPFIVQNLGKYERQLWSASKRRRRRRPPPAMPPTSSSS